MQRTLEGRESVAGNPQRARSAPSLVPAPPPRERVLPPELRRPGHLDPARLPEVLWVEDLAVVLQKKPDSIRRMIRDGRLPAGRLGNRLYALREDLFAWIRSRGVA